MLAYGAPESPERPRRNPSPTVLLGILATSAGLCLLASAILSIESFDLAREYAALPEETRPDSFPMPKPLLGVLWMPVVTTVGVAGLAGARVPRAAVMAVTLIQLVGVVLAFIFTGQILATGGVPTPWRWVLTASAAVALAALAWITIRGDLRPSSK